MKTNKKHAKTFVHQKLSATTQSSIKVGFYLISLEKKKRMSVTKLGSTYNKQTLCDCRVEKIKRFVLRDFSSFNVSRD